MKLNSRVFKDNRDAYLFVFPALLVFAFFTIYPTVSGFVTSLYKWDGFTEKTFVGLNNYIKLFQDSTFWTAISHNTYYAVFTVIAKVTIGFLTAVLLNGKFRGTQIYRTIFFTPMVMSFVAVGVLWSWIFNPTFGLANTILQHIGWSGAMPIWLGDPKLVLPALMFVDIWRWSGYHTVLYLAGLQSISVDIYEAAAVDGCNGLRKMLYITIPQMKAVIIMNFAICLMGAFNLFDLVYVTTKGGPYGSSEVLLTYMYKLAFAGRQFGYATTIGYVNLLFIIVVTTIQLRAMRKD
jgi:ABC-type sugar transport system permease subunit